MNQNIEEIKFAVECGKEITVKEVKDEVHFYSEGVGHWVVSKDEAEEIKEILPKKEEENPRFATFEKEVEYKGVKIKVKTNFYEYKKTVTAHSEGMYTWTKTNIEEDLLKTHYRKMKKKGLI